VNLSCQQDDRRDAVRRMNGRNGLDYVEVSGEDQSIIFVYFLGKLPPELAENKPGIERYLKIEGGERVTDIRIKDIDPIVSSDEETDDYLEVTLNKYGDFSTYTVRMVGVKDIDPFYDHVEFNFKIDCPSDLECARACSCEQPVLPEPEINYLARDYQSFRQLILDRLAVLMPDWLERHAADLGIALVELLAYTGDNLGYYQDAVATEAFLNTARQRISVRRHARLVDYHLHEGCNARAWVCVEVKPDLRLDDPTDIAFITGLNQALTARQNVLSSELLRDVPPHSYEVFEPVDRTTPIELWAAHNEIYFYTSGNTRCCLERGSTSATLLDSWVPSDHDPQPGKDGEQHPKHQAEAYRNPPQLKHQRALKLKRGDVLIFEEVLGPITGLTADANPLHRHAVRLTRVAAGEDTLVRTEDGKPTPYVRIEWDIADSLPFTFCISAIGASPECRYLENISVVRGNVVLVDHGQTQNSEDLGVVPTAQTNSICECAGEPSEVEIVPGRFLARLKKGPLTFSTPLPRDHSRQETAAEMLTQDVRLASPQVWPESDLTLSGQPPVSWQARSDLIASGNTDKHFVVEIDNDGIAHLRFGDGEMGYRPAAGTHFKVTYRIGNGSAGTVGAESISRLVVNQTELNGVFVSVRNPLPARGGTDPEPTPEAKLFAPYLFRKELERAIIADDYQKIAERNPKLQRASGSLVWTGSWYEAEVAVDPLGRQDAGSGFMRGMEAYLERYRRLGHDLAVVRARYVPLRLKLEVCVLPHYQHAHVKAALLEVFSNRNLAGGATGFFHPDKLTFGEGIYLSRIIAAGQAVAGVECVRVREFRRLFQSPNHEIENGVLPLQASEIARLDNDPNYPEHGQLEIQVVGGR